MEVAWKRLLEIETDENIRAALSGGSSVGTCVPNWYTVILKREDPTTIEEVFYANLANRLLPYKSFYLLFELKTDFCLLTDVMNMPDLYIELIRYFNFDVFSHSPEEWDIAYYLLSERSSSESVSYRIPIKDRRIRRVYPPSIDQFIVSVHEMMVVLSDISERQIRVYKMNISPLIEASRNIMAWYRYKEKANEWRVKLETLKEDLIKKLEDEKNEFLKSESSSRAIIDLTYL